MNLQKVMHKISFGIFFMVIVLTSCNETVDNFYTVDGISKAENLQQKRKTFYSNGQLKSAVDTTSGNDFGNRYEFDGSGMLKQYSFQVDSVNSTYIIKFNSEGKIINILGEPLVYKFMSADEAPDSFYVKYYISDFPHYNHTLFLSEDGSNFRQMKTKRDENLAFTSVFEYWKNTKNVDRIFIVSKLQTLSEDSVSRVVMDTIDLSRNTK